MRPRTLALTLFALIFAQFGRNTHALSRAQTDVLEFKIRAAAGRAAQTCAPELKSDIAEIKERISYALFMDRYSLAARNAILDEMHYRDLILLLEYRIELKQNMALHEDIDSNFSRDLPTDFREIAKAHESIIDRAKTDLEWLAVANQVDQTLLLLRYLSRLPITKWIPYQGERNSTSGNAALIMGAVTGDQTLAKLGLLMNSFDTPIHEKAPDPEQAQLIREAYIQVENSLLQKLNQRAYDLEVSLATRALAVAKRPINALTFPVKRTVHAACNWFLRGY